jgi:transcriptional regulator with XRE-family HTH domain
MPRVITPLKLAIVRSGRTQREVAEAIGISEKKLSLVANGLHVDDGTRQAIAAELGQTVTDLWPTSTPKEAA